MKVSRFIIELGDFLEEYGDLEVYLLLNDQLYEPFIRNSEDYVICGGDLRGADRVGLILDYEEINLGDEDADEEE